jgi:hypothetical protein
MHCPVCATNPCDSTIKHTYDRSCDLCPEPLKEESDTMWMVEAIIEGREVIRRFDSISDAAYYMDHIANAYNDVLFQVILKRK